MQVDDGRFSHRLSHPAASGIIQVNPSSVTPHLDLRNRVDFPERGTQTFIDHVLVLGIEHQPTTNAHLLLLAFSLLPMWDVGSVLI
jgi:hypothetical protein